MSDQVHPAFEELDQRRIKTLDLTAHKFIHRKTGAEHLHFDADNDENVFLVALRTMPDNSTGVAHVLEHTALCGSERFPVRDPFFLMIRRSLNTFMNALTYNDFTAYPFATQNRKDFFNLLDIYLDAVFFSRLDPLDFAQEGHRLEFSDPEDTTTDLVYKGVVYNEMKGDCSSPVSFLFSTLQQHLYPTTTYHHNSGGDPKVIPSLRYEDLLDFYRSHYHPSNAVFMTFGNIPVAELHAAFEDKALARFEKRDDIITVGPEQRYQSPIRVIEPYPEPLAAQHTHIVMAWLLGESIDLDRLLRCHLVSDVLLDTSASLLRKALEESDLGKAVSPLCGHWTSNREMSFMCGLEGSEAESAHAVERLVEETLARVVEEGIDIEQLESTLHQLELSQREIGGDGVPYGLQIIDSCLPAAVHRGDPLGLLDLDPAIEKLREEIHDPDFLPELVRDLLIDNPHRVTLVLTPDADMSDREVAEEKAKLNDIKRDLSSDGVRRVVEQAKQLANRQQEEEDLSVLPKVGLEDIGLGRADPISTVIQLPNGQEITRYAVGANGITYQQVFSALPDIAPALCQLLPLYMSLVTEIGSAERGYLETQLLQYARTGGINAFLTVRTDIDSPSRYRAFCGVSSKSLADKSEDMFRLIHETRKQPNFNEPSRIRDLVRQLRARRDDGITGSGHMFAMAAAAAPLRPVTNLNYQLSGLGGLINFRALDDSLDQPGRMTELQSQLSELHERLMSGASRLLLVADEESIEPASQSLSSLWPREDSAQTELFNIETTSVARDLAFTTNTQVNFCAQAYPTIPENHQDSPALSVLSGVLRNGYLHPTIREQGGAYGGGAAHDTNNGVFRLYSYRDPNLMDTFTAFDRSIEWVTTSILDFSLVEEAILGIVSSLDSPGSPAGEAKSSFANQIFGRPAEARQRFREAVLNTTVADVVGVAEKYLSADCCRAVITNIARQGELDKNFTTIEL